MQVAEGKKIIEQLRNKWVAFYAVKLIGLSLGISIFLTSISVFVLHWSPWLFLLAFLVSSTICLINKPFWRTSLTDVARYLNLKYPQLEESTELLLKNNEELTLLQKIQQQRVNHKLLAVGSVNDPIKKVYFGLATLLVGLLMSFAVSKIKWLKIDPKETTINRKHIPIVKENIPATVADYEVTIKPPAYTRKSVRSQMQFAIKAEAGASISWKIQTNVPVKSFFIIFNDKEKVKLNARNDTSTEFRFVRTAQKSGYYQLIINGKKSDLYQMEIIPDLPATIKVLTPAQHTTIDVGQPQTINLKATIRDDYGIVDAHISATMASGKGEGVSFTEKKLNFDFNFSNQKNIVLNKKIDLKSLGMKPGDELYFFIRAIDNHGQSSRSDIYFLSIVDTTELMSMAGMTNGVSLVPEYFRSQRQIIIDTEKLLKEQATITTAVFKARSNELGVDQKLLRLRYGKFLGEEDETEIGGEHHENDGHNHGKPQEEKFGDAAAIMDKYAHKHDIAEDATFFEPQLKAQLKAVLAEMWKSELRLRLYEPQQALPFEYKALRLLKDLQQKSRAYVAKTTVKKAALKHEKRLTGELDKITQPVQKMSFEEKENREARLKSTLSLIESMKVGLKLNSASLSILNDTEKYMIGAAADRPGTYLNALTVLRKLSTTKKWTPNEIDLLQQAIQKMMRIEYQQPQVADKVQSSILSQTYFNHLKKGER